MKKGYSPRLKLEVSSEDEDSGAGGDDCADEDDDCSGCWRGLLYLCLTCRGVAVDKSVVSVIRSTAASSNVTGEDNKLLRLERNTNDGDFFMLSLMLFEEEGAAVELLLFVVSIDIVVVFGHKLLYIEDEASVHHVIFLLLLSFPNIVTFVADIAEKFAKSFLGICQLEDIGPILFVCVASKKKKDMLWSWCVGWKKVDDYCKCMIIRWIIYLGPSTDWRWSVWIIPGILRDLPCSNSPTSCFKFPFLKIKIEMQHVIFE